MEPSLSPGTPRSRAEVPWQPLPQEPRFHTINSLGKDLAHLGFPAAADGAARARRCPGSGPRGSPRPGRGQWVSRIGVGAQGARGKARDEGGGSVSPLSGSTVPGASRSLAVREAVPAGARQSSARGAVQSNFENDLERWSPGTFEIPKR